MTKTEMESLQSQLLTWPRYRELASIVCPTQLNANYTERLFPLQVGRTMVIPPELVVVDPKIPTLCQLPYPRTTGESLSCGGTRHHRSACPPYAPTPEQTQAKLSQANAVAVIQAENLTDYDHQKQLHYVLLQWEERLKTAGFNIVDSWAAGPCRICEPEQECLGNGKCRQPKLRRFSMEGSGMAVFATCERIADLSGDKDWKLELIENWKLPNQSRNNFKSVVLIAVK